MHFEWILCTKGTSASKVISVLLHLERKEKKDCTVKLNEINEEDEIVHFYWKVA